MMAPDTDIATTKRVKIVWGEDDQAYVLDGTGDEPADEERTFVADIPVALWEAQLAAFNEWRRIDEQIIQLAGVDEEGARLLECCPEWTGYVMPGRRWFTIEIPGSGQEDVWPRGDHTHSIKHADSRDEAEAYVARLPETFMFNYGGWPLTEVRRDSLVIGESGHRESTSSCYRCGWERTEHADPGHEKEFWNAGAALREDEGSQ